MPTGGAKTTKISIDAETGEEVREDWPFNEAMWYIKEILDARKGYGSKKGKPGAVAGGQRGQYVKVEKAEEIAGLSKEIAGMTAQLAAMPAASPARAQVERELKAARARVAKLKVGVKSEEDAEAGEEESGGSGGGAAKKRASHGGGGPTGKRFSSLLTFSIHLSVCRASHGPLKSISKPMGAKTP